MCQFNNIVFIVKFDINGGNQSIALNKTKVLKILEEVLANLNLSY